MKASPWEKEDAEAEGIPIYNNHVPKEFVGRGRQAQGHDRSRRSRRVYDEKGKRTLVPTGEDLVFMEADDVLMAIGQENSFPWIERDLGDRIRQVGHAGGGHGHLPVHAMPKVFFGGDAAFGPENIITAVAHGHQAAVSIDLFCRGEDVRKRPPPHVTLVSQKMGVHEWSYDNASPTTSVTRCRRRRWRTR